MNSLDVMVVWLTLTLLLSITNIISAQSAPPAFVSAPAPAPAPEPPAFVSAPAAVLPAYDIAKPGCKSTCGSLVIPYPFGTTKGCYLENKANSFLITCNDTRPYLSKSRIPVRNISLNDHHVHISNRVARICYNESGYVTSRQPYSLRLSKFPVNSTRNKFTVIGCSTLALITGKRVQNYTTGCASVCKGVESAVNGSCSGIGCCQTSLPIGARDFSVSFGSFNNSVLAQIPCSSAFVAEEGAYNFSSSDLNALDQTSFPVMLDWAVENITCATAQKNSASYACVAPGSTCTNSVYGNGTGYQCNCPDGFEGNPYLPHGCIGTFATCSVCQSYSNIKKSFTFLAKVLTKLL